MDPVQLQKWETILQSQVAVALLLLAALAVVSAVLFGWIRSLHRENHELHAEFRRHLEADLALRQAVDEWAIRRLIHSHVEEGSDAPSA